MIQAKPKLVVLSGAGISAESGIKTFRGDGGLWEGYRVEDVATPGAWRANQRLVLQFYNERRAAVRKAKPNRAHLILAEMESDFDVRIVTQNVDDLHERAGSKNIIHLHGSLFGARSTKDPRLTYPVTGDRLEEGDLCSLGSQLRPDIVWFGEEVPLMPVAEKLAATAQAFLIVGTSLQVYPAAGLIWSVPEQVPVWVVDPGDTPIAARREVRFFQEGAGTGMEKVWLELKSYFSL